jgi:hypothetical protein
VAIELRATGLTVPILKWLNPSGVDAEGAAADQIDVAIGYVDELEALLGRASTSLTSSYIQPYGCIDANCSRPGPHLRCVG